MPKRKKKRIGKGQIIDWDITVNEKENMYFTVSMTWECGTKRTFHYTFDTETEFWKRWEQFKKQHPSKEIMQEVWDEVIHSYAATRMVANERYAGRQEQSRIPDLADDGYVKQWLSVSSLRELCDDSTSQEEI